MATGKMAETGAEDHLAPRTHNSTPVGPSQEETKAPGEKKVPTSQRGTTRRGSNSDGASRRTAAAADRWWKIHLFRGMANDVRRRAPYYWSDWVDAWNYRVVPATVYMYFANILPALAFSLDMFTKTDSHYGVNEVLLASVLGAVVFSLVACQPLVIVGVTGPITVFNYTVYDIMSPRGTNYLAFMCWIGLWSLVFHWILAVTNSCNWLKYVTRFPCDIFGFYVALIYLQKGIQVLERFGDEEPFYLSVMVALLVFMIAYACGELGNSTLFWHPVRIFIKDYGTPLTVIFFTGFVHIGRMESVALERLPTSKSFFPTADRDWFIRFWEIPVGDVFLAIPFAILLTILFWFDHNVSSLIAQGTEFPLRKPAGFHWDVFLLGLTTGVAGLLGLPFPNGLIPQAPFHTESLCVTEVVSTDDSSDGAGGPADEGGDNKGHALRRSHVVEQRVSNLAQGLLTLGTMSGPLLVVLHLIPQGVLAGLFFIMGYQALAGNGITAKLLFLLRDRRLTPPAHPLRRLAARRPLALPLFAALELFGFGVTFAITQTVAAVGFPVCILALIPVRAALLPRLFAPADLALLDEPTASPFTMESVGGAYGGGGGAAAAGEDEDEDEDEDDGASVTADEDDGAGRDEEKKHKARGGALLHGRLSDEELAERGQAKRVRSTGGGGEGVVMGRALTGGSAVSRRSHGRSVGE